RRAIPGWLEDAENSLTMQFRVLLDALWSDLRHLDGRVAELDADIRQLANTDPQAKRLQQLRGVGPLIATALLATVGTGEQFANGRQMSAALGLVPRQHDSGDKRRRLGITKRGDAYLRSLLIHGARAVIRTAGNKEDRLSQWVTALADRRHPNVAAVALANKTVRMAWAMLSRDADYQPWSA
ncbi:MAG: IS110 family transposase, partial [Burkholderiales bacterium]|nr:IS110 family transposase [Burkholderiales bacterium]